MKNTLSKTKSIILDRKAGNSLQVLARKYGIDWRGIKRILVDFGEYKDTRHAQARNEWNEYFFDNKNPISAYWAGFIFADGCITSQKYGTRIHVIIQESDSGHLENLARTIGFPVNKIYQNKTKSKTIQFYTHRKQDFIDVFKKWGIVPRKTYNFVVPQIPKDLIPHFLRGWCDGDGHIYSKPGQQRFEMVGNSVGLDWYIEKLREFGYKGHINIYDKNNKIWKRFLITGINQIRHIALILHADDKNYPKLDRKWLHLFK